MIAAGSQSPRYRKSGTPLLGRQRNHHDEIESWVKTSLKCICDFLNFITITCLSVTFRSNFPRLQWLHPSRWHCDYLFKTRLIMHYEISSDVVGVQAGDSREICSKKWCTLKVAVLLMKPIAFLTSMFSGLRGCVSLLMEGNYVNLINLQYDIESKVLRTVFILMITVRDESKLLIQAKFSFCLILSIETRCYHLFESFDAIHCPGKQVCPR